MARQKMKAKHDSTTTHQISGTWLVLWVMNIYSYEYMENEWLAAMNELANIILIMVDCTWSYSQDAMTFSKLDFVPVSTK